MDLELNSQSPTPAEIADVLDAAHDVMLDRGWTKHVLVHPLSGSVCALGAIAVARNLTSYGMWLYPDEQDSDVAARQAAQALIAACNSSCSVQDWNDADGRTADEVFDLLRNTAKELRS